MDFQQWFESQVAAGLESALDSIQSMDSQGGSPPYVNVRLPSNVASAATAYGSHFGLTRDQFIEASLHLVYEAMIAGRLGRGHLVARLSRD